MSRKWAASVPRVKPLLKPGATSEALHLGRGEKELDRRPVVQSSFQNADFKRLVFSQSVVIWVAVSSARVGPLYFIKSRINAAIYLEILEHFMFPPADELNGDADFFFPAGI